MKGCCLFRIKTQRAAHIRPCRRLSRLGRSSGRFPCPPTIRASVRDSAQVLIPASFQPLLFPSPEGNMTKIRLPLLHESSEQSCNSAPFKKQSCKSAEGSMPVETIFRSFRRGWREGLSCKSACGTGVLTKKNCTATLTHIVSELPCSYARFEGTSTLFHTIQHLHSYPICTHR